MDSVRLVNNQVQQQTKENSTKVKGIDLFMLKSCFTSVLVQMDFDLKFMHFSSIWGPNDLFSIKIMNQPIRADFTTIG